MTSASASSREPERPDTSSTPTAPPGAAPPPRSAHVAMIVCTSLCAQVASQPAYTDVVSATPPDTRERANKWVVLAISATAAFMTTLDASIVNISLPAIAHAFGVPLAGSIEWVIIGYLVVIAAILLTAGRLADMFGQRPIFVVGVAIFTLGSVCCGAAPGLGALIAARIFQGLGASLIFAVNLAMVTHAFPAAERGRALGINAVVVALGVTAGPTIGGLLTQSLSWRWIFYVNVPIGAAVLIAAWRLLTERIHHSPVRFDLAGAALLALGLALVTLGMSFGQEWGWTSPRFLLSVVGGIVALAIALTVERRQAAPILDFALLRSRVFASSEVSFTLCMLALFAVGFLLPFYLEELRGYNALQAGLLLTPLSLVLAVVAPISGVLADRLGSSWLAPLGLGIAGVGLLLLSGLNAQRSVAYLILCLVVTGIGQGLFQSPNTRALMGAAPAGRQGVASGLLATGRVVGQTLSVAISGAVFTSSGAAAAGATLTMHRGHLSEAQVTALQQVFVSGLHAAFLVCAVLAAIGVGAALLRGQSGA